MPFKFCCLGSGSNGNCTYIGTNDTNILVDAGFSGKTIVEHLGAIGVTPDSIDAIFVTHEHSDHTKGIGILSRKYDIPVYATFGTWQSMQKDIGAIAPSNINYVYAKEPCAINDIVALPIEIPHDASEPVAYKFTYCNKKIGIATDIGYITDTLKENISDCNILLLESNHDIKRLKSCSYPWPLKQRILSDRGHLSNEAAGNFLAEIYNRNLKHIFLGHLSEESNDVHLAYETVSQILAKNNININEDLSLDVATRYSNSPEIII